MREDIIKIESELLRATDELNSFEVGDEMYNNRVKAILGLLDVRKKLLDEEERKAKVQKEWEIRQNTERVRAESDVLDRGERERRFESEEKHKYIGYAINIAGIVLPLIFYGAWFKKGLQFEETGVYTSNTVKTLTNKMSK